MIYSNSSGGSNAQAQVLVAEELHKTYGARPALRGLSFSLRAGRVLGFLGPNGAGKTTAIRILTTILQPTSGDFFVDGISAKYPEKIRRKIGVLPESLGFSKQSTAIEYLTYYGRLYGRPAADARTNGMTLLKEVGLEQRSRSLIGTYSRGMRQRVGIARALVNDPTVVFLDEPTLGLDPRGQQDLLQLIKRTARDRNVGIVLCSHALSEIEDICDDVVILSSGQVVAAGPVTEVIGQSQGTGSVFRIRVASASAVEAQRILETLPIVRQAISLGETAGWLRVELTEQASATSMDENHSNKILDVLIRAGVPILGFETAGGRLQDVFLHLTEGTIR